MLILLTVVLEFSSDLLIRQHYFLIKVFGNSDIFWETYFLNSHKSGKIDNTSCFSYDPSLGWKSKNSCTNLENGITFSTDSIGMRHIPYGNDPSARSKILFIGDSFTEGAEVSDSFSFPALLQKIRPDLKILNSGVGGYSHSQMLLLLKERILQLQPTQVILGFVNDDVSRNQLVFNGFAKPAYSIKDNKLVLKNGNVKPPKVLLDEHPFKSSTFLLLRFLISHKQTYSNNDDIEVTRLLISEMNETCAQNKIPFIAILIPTISELQHATDKSIFDVFEKNFASDAITFYSLEAVFKKEQDVAEDGKPNGHWGEKANAVIASELATKVFDE